jgi:hypothetical protein
MPKQTTRVTNQQRVPATVEAILQECEAEMRRGLGRKKLSEDAYTFWRDHYTYTVSKQLKKGDTWNDDKERVLHVAHKLGLVAAALASRDEVETWAAKAASVAVRSDPWCPKPGSGGYCDPD